MATSSQEWKGLPAPALLPAQSMSLIPQQSADRILGDSFLEVRAKLLEIAATLDRIDRAAVGGTPLNPQSQAHRAKLITGLEVCLSDRPDRATQLQQLFSRPFDKSWREEMSL